MLKLDENGLLKANSVILETLKKYKPENIALSFNGGKDCTAILYLVKAMCEYMA